MIRHCTVLEERCPVSGLLIRMLCMCEDLEKASMVGTMYFRLLSRC